MKKILYVVEGFGGGVFTFLADLIKELNSNYEITIAYALRPQTPENFKEYFPNSIKFIEVKNFKRSINIFKDLKALLEIKKIIKNTNPDIIHMHSSKAGVIGRFAGSGKKYKMFYNPHGFSFLKKDDSFIKRKIYWIIEKMVAIFNKKCTIIGCSKGEYQEALKINKNSQLINNGVNIDEINNIVKPIQQPKNKIKICTIGRIDYQKNPKLFNQIANELNEFEFTWIGQGNLKDELTSPNIMITGWLERKKVLEELNKNDVFILTSLWEGLPIALLEAMYLKKICIVSDCVGNRDVIKNNENGFIAKTTSEYVKIIKDIEKNEVKNDIALKAHQDIVNIYNTKNMTNLYKKIYEEE